MSRPRNYVSALPAPQPAITVVMAALALVTMVALFLTATAAVTVPIAVVLATGAMVTTGIMVRERRKRTIEHEVLGLTYVVRPPNRPMCLAGTSLAF